jgi:hypothetical protein
MLMSIIHEERWISVFNHIKLMYKKKSIINMETKLYSKMPGYRKVMDNYKAYEKELKSVLLCHAFYSVEESVS